MFVTKLFEFMDSEQYKANKERGVSTEVMLYDFAHFLDRDAEQRNGADLPQQICPLCNDTGIDPDCPDGLERECPNCHGQI